MQELIAAVAALAGILAGIWIRSSSAKREKQQLESRANDLAVNLAQMKAELGNAQALADGRAGF